MRHKKYMAGNWKLCPADAIIVRTSDNEKRWLERQLCNCQLQQMTGQIRDTTGFDRQRSGRSETGSNVLVEDVRCCRFQEKSAIEIFQKSTNFI